MEGLIGFFHLFCCIYCFDEFLTMRRETGSLMLGELPWRMSKVKNVGENLTEDERAAFLHDSYKNLGD
ncbi:putative fimbrin/Plastin [Helianthus anomalus]